MAYGDAGSQGAMENSSERGGSKSWVKKKTKSTAKKGHPTAAVRLLRRRQGERGRWRWVLLAAEEEPPVSPGRDDAGAIHFFLQSSIDTNCMNI
jgi:hypothetical protein